MGKTAMFTKEKIIKSDKYSQQADVLTAILEDGKTYTLKEVDRLIDEFNKKKVM